MNAIRVRLYAAVSKLAIAHGVFSEIAEQDAKFAGMRDRAFALWDEAETELRAIEEDDAAEQARMDAEDALDTRGKEEGR